MKSFFFTISVLFSTIAMANMASPVQGGDRGLKSISSKNIDIVNEQINIHLDRAFQQPQIEVKYRIYSAKSGKKIPLLFIALGGYGTHFDISFDGKPVESKEVPSNWVNKNPTLLDGFSESWLFQDLDPQDDLFVEYDSSGEEYRRYQLYELNYFEVDIDSGHHEITIEYQGIPTVDRSDPVKRYELYYSLSPVLYWKSFAGVSINVTSEIPIDSLSFNTSPTSSINGNEVNFRIDSLDQNYFKIAYVPIINPTAAKLLKFGNWNISIAIGLLLFILNIFLNWLYRKRNKRKYSIVVIAGSLLVPLLFLLSYMQSFEWIDNLIGIHASKYHGYTFISLILYPLIVAVYWFVMWLIDKYQRKRTGAPYV